MEMRDYIEELRNEYSINRLVADFIYVGAYEWLNEQGLIANEGTKEWDLMRYEAAKYYQLYQRKYGRKLAEITGETMYESDFKKQARKTQNNINNLTRKLLVYEFIASGKAFNLLNNNQHESSTE